MLIYTQIISSPKVERKSCSLYYLKLPSFYIHLPLLTRARCILIASLPKTVAA